MLKGMIIAAAMWIALLLSGCGHGADIEKGLRLIENGLAQADVRIERLRVRVGDALQRIELLMARQGHMIETVAINRLVARRDRLVAQQTQARFAVADSYDRAARDQSGAEGH